MIFKWSDSKFESTVNERVSWFITQTDGRILEGAKLDLVAAVSDVRESPLLKSLLPVVEAVAR